ncbi:hypothetical protein WJX82_010520 [Trebouxia sp. C0006]
MINLLVWLLAFLMQAGLLGIVMYSLISLSDLENDFVNPHDSSAALNKWVLVIFLFSFVLIIYRLVESAVTRLLTDEGRDTAKQLLRDAAVTF